MVPLQQQAFELCDDESAIAAAAPGSAEEQMRIWILYSVFAAIESGGLSFATYLPATFDLALDYALLSFTGEHPSPAHFACIVRLLNCIIAAYGPELSEGDEGQARFIRCTALLHYFTVCVSSSSSRMSAHVLHVHCLICLVIDCSMLHIQ